MYISKFNFVRIRIAYSEPFTGHVEGKREHTTSGVVLPYFTGSIFTSFADLCNRDAPPCPTKDVRHWSKATAATKDVQPAPAKHMGKKVCCHEKDYLSQGQFNYFLDTSK